MKQQKVNFLRNKSYDKQKYTIKRTYNARIYNVGVFNFFNPELHLKDTESAIINKLKDLLKWNELKWFKFVTI